MHRTQPHPNKKKKNEISGCLFDSALLQHIIWIYALLEQSDNQN